MKKGLSVLLGVLLLAFAGCQQQEKWEVAGHILGAENDTLFVKCLRNNKQEVITQKVLKASGQFSFRLDKKEFNEFYFLQVNTGNQLVLVRDSFDLIEVVSATPDLSKAEIRGSEVSSQIQCISNDIMHLRKMYKSYVDAELEEKDTLAIVFMKEYDLVKASIGDVILQAPQSLFSYYALFQRITPDNLLFTPYDDKDYQYFATVATSYDVYRKEDPRTKALHDRVMGVLTERRKARLSELVANAPSGLPDIIMNDVNGDQKKLSDFQGQVVALNFWSSTNRSSRIFNMNLRSIYKKYNKQGFTVYQVSADKSNLLWKQAITQDQLPWTNVCECDGDLDNAFLVYNVKTLPTTYLIGRDGLMIDKFTNAEALENAIKEAL